MTVLCSRLCRRMATQALNTAMNLRSTFHRSARRGPSAMRWSVWSTSLVAENHPRGSKILASISAMSGLA